jgi:thiol-disulfide isomerase/thioredoxin
LFESKIGCEIGLGYLSWVMQKNFRVVFVFLSCFWFLAVGCITSQHLHQQWLACWRAENSNWRGVHLWIDNDASARELISTLPRLAADGANVVVIEVNYSFEFQAHPELRNPQFVTRATAHELAAAARACGIRLIPEFNCLGHQSFGGKISPLLIAHPEFNETPSQTFTNKNFYSLSWCPRAPGLNKIIFSLIDEMADAFEADAFHVGMDEVYFIGSDECPRCRDENPAELFAAQVNALHAHIVGKRHWKMLMWADRVIGPKFQGYSRFDNSSNDLSAAIHLIPHDIVMCDWHYEWKTNYPSLPYLTGKGFRVWPAGFLPLKAAAAFSDFAQHEKNNQIIGYLATTWNETSISNSPDWPPIKEILPRWKK